MGRNSPFFVKMKLFLVDKLKGQVCDDMLNRSVSIRARPEARQAAWELFFIIPLNVGEAPAEAGETPVKTSSNET